MAESKYPTRPIRFVVAFNPGGVDIIARLFGDRLSDKLGQTLFIDNKGGAAGELGAKVVSTADPDGYTFLVTTTAIAIGAATSPNNVDPRKNVVPVGAVPAFDTSCLNAKGSLFLARPSLTHNVANRGDLEGRTSDIFRWIKDGKLDVKIDRSFHLREASKSHEHLESRRAIGKSLLTR